MSIIRNLFYTSTCFLLVHHSQIITTACGNQFSTKAIFISDGFSKSKTSSSCAGASIQQLREMSDNKDFKYDAGTSSVAFVTAPDDKVAKKLAHGLVEKKLAACVNIIPNIQSIYMWEGKVNEDSEYLMMIKTQTNCVDELTKYVRENHPYSVAEVITLPIEQGNLPYMKWLAETVGAKKS